MVINAGPFLRWAGSKKKLLPFLSPYWKESYGRYIEPFAGSACLFFKVAPKSAKLGDINKHLVGTFKAVRNHPMAVIKAMTRWRASESVYYEVRAHDLSQLSPTEKAARFIYLNRYCFNGIYRTNLRGEFNVPYGRSKTGNLPTLDELIACSEILRKAELFTGDFESCLQDVRKGDFIYLDPPYAVSSRRIFREYAPKSFDKSDLQRMQRCVQKIDDVGAHFVLSYAFCSESLGAFSKWHLRKVRTVRNVAGFARARKFAFEIIATNITIDDWDKNCSSQ